MSSKASCTTSTSGYSGKSVQAQKLFFFSVYLRSLGRPQLLFTICWHLLSSETDAIGTWKIWQSYKATTKSEVLPIQSVRVH